MPEKEIHQSGTFSTKSGNISTSAECSNSCDFGIKIFFGSGKFSTKVEKIPLYLFGMKLGVLVCPDEQKKLLPKCKIFPTKSGNLVRHPALVLYVLCFRLIFLLKRNM